VKARLRTLPLAALALAAGCNALQRATADRTQLAGDVPTSLGRVVEVRLSGAKGVVREELIAAVREELVGQDLFDHVDEVPEDGPGERPARRASTLELALVEHESEEVFDLFELQTGYVERYELEARVRDTAGEVVLAGHVSGIGVDAVTDSDFLDEARRADVRRAALHDVAAKVSRSLRAKGDRRARAALAELEPVPLPPGVGPLRVAVLGFDDEEVARLRRGPELRFHVARALEALGPDFEVVDLGEVDRALARLPPVDYLDVAPHQVRRLTSDLDARAFVVGRVTVASDRLTVEAKVLDAAGAPVAEPVASEDGLGALRVAAARLAAGIGAAIAESPPEPPGGPR